MTTAEHAVIIEHSSDKTVLTGSHKLGWAAEHLIDGSKKCTWNVFELSFDSEFACYMKGTNNSSGQSQRLLQL